MPPRTPLGPISGNRRRGKELTSYERGQIVAHHDSGRTYKQVTRIIDISPNTIAKTIQKVSIRHHSISQPRSSRPSKTSPRDRRRVLYTVKKFPNASYAKIRTETGIKVSDSTLYRILTSFHIDHWITKKRPILTKDQVKVRLQWAEERKIWTFDDWKKVIFTDECSLERGSGKRPTWIWCYKH